MRRSSHKEKWSLVILYLMLSVMPPQDDTSNPGMPFACGLTLEKLSAHTIDEDGNQAFVKDNPLAMLRKVISRLRCLCSHSHADPHGILCATDCSSHAVASGSCPLASKATPAPDTLCTIMQHAGLKLQR